MGRTLGNGVEAVSLCEEFPFPRVLEIGERERLHTLRGDRCFPRRCFRFSASLPSFIGVNVNGVPFLLRRRSSSVRVWDLFRSSRIYHGSGGY